MARTTSTVSAEIEAKLKEIDAMTMRTRFLVTRVNAIVEELERSAEALRVLSELLVEAA